MRKPADSEGAETGRPKKPTNFRGAAIRVAVVLGILIAGGVLIRALLKPPENTQPVAEQINTADPVQQPSAQPVINQKIKLDPQGTNRTLIQDDQPTLRRIGNASHLMTGFWWEGVPTTIQNASLDTGELSNVRPTDYAGPQSCANCHKGNYEQWSNHSHRWMNAPANVSTVKGDFTFGAKMDYYNGQVTFFIEDDDYVMHLVRDKLRRTYRITQTIGSRFFQYYVGVQTGEPRPT